MIRSALAIAYIPGVMFTLAGCVDLTRLPEQTDAASRVEAKAASVAEEIGGVSGFGGMMMDGYFEHAEQALHFTSTQLADPDTPLSVTLENAADEPGTVHLAFFASHMGFDEQTQDVEVPAGGEVTVEIPCPEIIGTGSLETVGFEACHLESGEVIDNMMSVPAFLGLDYVCGDEYHFMLVPDAEDLDGDGDTEELVMLSDALERHMLDGGPHGHMHGPGFGMMGMHVKRR